MVYYWKKEYTSAEEIFDTALKKATPEKEYVNAYINSLIELKKYTKATSYINKHSDGVHHLQLKSAYLFFLQKRYAKARKTLYPLIKTTPSNELIQAYLYYSPDLSLGDKLYWLEQLNLSKNNQLLRDVYYQNKHISDADSTYFKTEAKSDFSNEYDLTTSIYRRIYSGSISAHYGINITGESLFQYHSISQNQFTISYKQLTQRFSYPYYNHLFSIHFDIVQINETSVFLSSLDYLYHISRRQNILFSLSREMDNSTYGSVNDLERRTRIQSVFNLKLLDVNSMFRLDYSKYDRDLTFKLIETQLSYLFNFQALDIEPKVKSLYKSFTEEENLVTQFNFWRPNAFQENYIGAEFYFAKWNFIQIEGDFFYGIQSLNNASYYANIMYRITASIPKLHLTLNYYFTDSPYWKSDRLMFSFNYLF